MSELKDLLFEIDDSFSRARSRIHFIKNIKNVDELFNWFEYLKYDLNDLNFYTRALRDLLNENKKLDKE